MKKIIIFSLITCILLTGCRFGISMSDENADMESSVGIFNVRTSYFDRYSINKDEDSCEAKGRLHQAADDDNCIITYMTAEGGDGSVMFAGIMENDSAEDIEDVKMPEIRKDPEKPEKPEGIEKARGMDEDMENIETDMDDIGEGIEIGGLDEIEDNWPESIRYSGDGVYADPMSVQFQVDAPMTLSLSCVTRSGELWLKIVNNDTLKETYFDEMNPNGQYIVDLDKKGTYTMLFYAKWHVGSVEMTPGND